MNYTITEIATIVKAQKRAYKDYTITALLTDSRSLTFPEETLFFALVTERNDGHRYIKDLYRKGVRNFVVEHRVADEELMPEANFIIVKNTLDATISCDTSKKIRYTGNRCYGKQRKDHSQRVALSTSPTRLQYGALSPQLQLSNRSPVIGMANRVENRDGYF